MRRCAPGGPSLAQAASFVGELEEIDDFGAPQYPLDGSMDRHDDTATASTSSPSFTSTFGHHKRLLAPRVLNVKPSEDFDLTGNILAQQTRLKFQKRFHLTQLGVDGRSSRQLPKAKRRSKFQLKRTAKPAEGSVPALPQASQPDDEPPSSDPASSATLELAPDMHITLHAHPSLEQDDDSPDSLHSEQYAAAASAAGHAVPNAGLPPSASSTIKALPEAPAAQPAVQGMHQQQAVRAAEAPANRSPTARGAARGAAVGKLGVTAPSLTGMPALRTPKPRRPTGGMADLPVLQQAPPGAAAGASHGRHSPVSSAEAGDLSSVYDFFTAPAASRPSSPGADYSNSAFPDSAADELPSSSSPSPDSSDGLRHKLQQRKGPRRFSMAADASRLTDIKQLPQDAGAPKEAGGAGDPAMADLATLTRAGPPTSGLFVRSHITARKILKVGSAALVHVVMRHHQRPFN